MGKRLAGTCMGVLLMLAGLSASPHHPFSSEYDWQKTVTLTGSVTRFEWANPHSMLFLKGMEGTGVVENWLLELGGPSVLSKAGWSEKTLEAGDTITVDAWLAKDGTKRANVKSVRFPDGKELSGGSSIVDPDQPKTDVKVSN